MDIDLVMRLGSPAWQEATERMTSLVAQNVRMFVIYCFTPPFSLHRVARYSRISLVRVPLNRRGREGTKNKRLNRAWMAASRGFSIKGTRRPRSAQVLSRSASGPPLLPLRYWRVSDRETYHGAAREKEESQLLVARSRRPCMHVGFIR